MPKKSKPMTREAVRRIARATTEASLLGPTAASCNRPRRPHSQLPHLRAARMHCHSAEAAQWRRVLPFTDGGQWKLRFSPVKWGGCGPPPSE